MLASLLRGDLARLVTRHRRLISAALAGLAVLILASTLTRPAASGAPVEGRGLAADEVAIPITVESRAIAEAVKAGDLVSVVAVNEEGFSTIVAENARVLTGSSSSGFGSSDAAITVAVDEQSALRLAAAPVRGTLTVLIRPTAHQ